MCLILSVVACPANAAGAPNCACNSGYSGSLSFSGGVWSGSCVQSGAIWQSTFNGAQVKAYLYSGPTTTLTWQIEHDTCSSYGKLSPGGSNPSYFNQYCSFSVSDNWIVTGSCNWASQSFTLVSGNVPTKAWMCAHLSCDHQVWVVGTMQSYSTSATVTIRTNDYIFCSP